MTRDTLRGLMRAVATAITEQTAPLRTRIAALEARPALEYRGVFAGDGTAYRPGDLCTRSGSLWLCIAATTAAPAEAPSNWKLIAKGGR